MSCLPARMALSSLASSAGAPARSAPAAVENLNSAWRLGCRPAGARRARVVIRQVGDLQHQDWEFVSACSRSCSEILVLALADGLARLRIMGATHVTVVVPPDSTLQGYLERGWRPGSVAMHQAVKMLIQASDGIELEFRVRVKK